MSETDKTGEGNIRGYIVIGMGRKKRKREKKAKIGQ